MQSPETDRCKILSTFIHVIRAQARIRGTHAQRYSGPWHAAWRNEGVMDPRLREDDVVII